VSELDSEVGIPPRQVLRWTRVAGHVIVRTERPPFCSCGWHAEARAGADEAIDEHLREAWPILVPKKDGESPAAWRTRVALLHEEAIQASAALWAEHRMDDGIRPGGSIPEIPRDWAMADERVQALDHQLQEMAAN
jgi:hypothetical protein